MILCLLSLIVQVFIQKLNSNLTIKNDWEEKFQVEERSQPDLPRQGSQIMFGEQYNTK